MKWTAILFLCVVPAWAQNFETGQAARLEIGQRVWSAQYPGASERNLGSLSGLAYVNNMLFVVDSNRLGATPNNNRVLLFQNVDGFIPPPLQELPVTADRCPSCVGSATNVLGQKDFFETEIARLPASNTVRSPVGVHSNGRYTAVADSDYNRVLVWRGVPTSLDQPADYVLGQTDFKSSVPGRTASLMRGPSGVWVDNNDGVWVADTANNRVLYFGVVTKSAQDAVLVLGQPDFTTNLQPDLVVQATITQANTMLSPMSVSTDGVRLFVSDQGANRVLIWNTIPTQNQQNADVVVGQPDMTTARPNNSLALCQPNGQDTDGNNLFPARCAATIDFPRFALSDGQRLFISDSGNDRVNVYNQIPTVNGASADAILGQQGDTVNQSSDSANPERVSASDSLRTPAGLAYDGLNLYVADTFNRRVMVFTPGDFKLPLTAARNAASLQIYAVGSVQVGGTLTEKDELTITIGNADDSIKTDYKYTVLRDDTFNSIVSAFVTQINADGGNPLVLATPNLVFNAIILTARDGGLGGNTVKLSTTVSTGATTTLTASGANLAGGGDAARIAPYTLVTILGFNLAEETISVPLTQTLPFELGGVQVYFDGKRAPIQSVSPGSITAQISAEVVDSTSANAVIRVQRKNGQVVVSAALAVLIIGENPGVFAQDTTDPRPALAYHASSSSTGTIAVDGTATVGDTGSIFIREREYKYTVVTDDALDTIRNGLIELINASDPEVSAYIAYPFTTIRLQAKLAGPDSNGIPLRTSVSSGASLLLTATNSEMCCANVAGAPVTVDNPAIPGEQIIVLATGLGLLQGDEAKLAMVAGVPYNGPVPTQPVEFVSSLLGGKTARVLNCGLRPGVVGIYEIQLELNPDLPTDPLTTATIAQSFQVSNIFTIPVLNPKQQ